MPAMDVHRLNERLRHAAENATALATASGAELALRRGRHRDRRRAGAALLVVAGLLGAVVLLPRLSTDSPAAPAGAPARVVRVPTQGFELPVPSGWRVQRELTGTRPAASSGASQSLVVGGRAHPPIGTAGRGGDHHHHQWL